eukprot:TRINITY_DN3932_c0_g2_i11.p2 TRINITY_DN3932_c0_g2~~TRINITY_DN3932_c0_g2_i11.p2  ORF type:complete len:110 (+),score=27.19 TRINITY_DN3932_c0_g2_i11:451-780(+)
MSASLDYFVSLLGSWELFRLYHHFIMVDDVAYLDDMGVPRRKDGDLACLVEYSSTPQCAFHTVWGPSGRGFAGLLPFLLDKLSLIHISEPTRLLSISYAVFCLKKKKKK